MIKSVRRESLVQLSEERKEYEHTVADRFSKAGGDEQDRW